MFKSKYREVGYAFNAEMEKNVNTLMTPVLVARLDRAIARVLLIGTRRKPT